MKKFFAFAVILALLVPAAAFAATEFTLGGFVKLDSFWDSTQAAKNMNTPILRNNDPNFHHGRVKFTAQGSRFNLTIKGPDLWGAKTTGFIEMDFDPNESPALGQQTASNSYTPRLRHAMFRFNWPTTELLFGQYWSMFCEFYNESVQDGPLQGHGTPTARLAQVRVSQQFADGWTIAGLIGEPNNITALNNATTNPYANFAGATNNTGEQAETPQVQAKLQYQQDLWGKAAYYGAPMPFTARVIGGWQRNVVRSNPALVTTASQVFGQNAFGAINASYGNHQYLDPWMVMGNVFLPIIPTHSANLAGTASLSVQAYVGQGLGAFGNNMGSDLNGKYQGSLLLNNVTGTFLQTYDQELNRQFGGYVQAQYYFTNQWFTNVTWGAQKQFGSSQATYNQLIPLVGPAGNTGGYGLVVGDQPNSWQELDFTLWYRPIQAIKFGLQYSWQRTTWQQVTANPAVNVNTGGIIAPTQANSSNVGNASRVEFVGFFYF
jgi:hypothetical protein